MVPYPFLVRTIVDVKLAGQVHSPFLVQAIVVRAVGVVGIKVVIRVVVVVRVGVVVHVSSPFLLVVKL